MKLLGIDTATEGCSAALRIDSELRSRGAESERGHAERILQMVDELLAECGVGLGGLDAIAFGRGPGSFTGVRLAASVTQGLAFGAGLPVIPISDLQAVAQQLWRGAHPGEPSQCPACVLVCNDARMQEVYWGCYARGDDGLMKPVGTEHVAPPDRVTVPSDWHSFAGAGRGFAVHEGLRTRFSPRLNFLAERLLPDAREVVQLAAAEYQAGRMVGAEYALPVYLRDDVARPQAR